MTLPVLQNERYELLDLLGSGGMATVYRARDRHTDRTVAVKILDERFSHRSEVLKRFELEAAAMEKLHHPNIVPLHDVQFDSDERFIVMDFIDGESLLDRLEQTPVAALEAIDLLVPVLSALELAHSNGIIHRDIKPHNILISKANQVFVSDFGIARVIDETDMSLTRTGVVMGTWAFMAPEQRADSKGVNESADIYSVGATLFAAVTGQTPKDLFAAELDPTIYRGVPRALEGVIRRACAYWTADRYGSAEAMRSDLMRVRAKLAAEGTTGEPPRVDFQTQPAQGPQMGPRTTVVTAPPSPPAGRALTSEPIRRADATDDPGRPPGRSDGNGNPLVLAAAAIVFAVVVGLVGVTMVQTLNTVDQTPETPVGQEGPALPLDDGVGEIQPVTEPEVPTLIHAPVEAVGTRETLAIIAEVTGSSAYDQVQAWYRPVGESVWSRAGMRRVGSEYRGTIDVTPLFADGLEYWIEAKPYHEGVPKLFHGSAQRPIRVTVRR